MSCVTFCYFLNSLYKPRRILLSVKLECHSIKQWMWAWICCSMVKSTSCSYWSLRFGFQYPQQVTENHLELQFHGIQYPLLSSAGVWSHVVCKRILRHKHEIKILSTFFKVNASILYDRVVNVWRIHDRYPLFY